MGVLCSLSLLLAGQQGGGVASLYEAGISGRVGLPGASLDLCRGLVLTVPLLLHFLFMQMFLSPEAGSLVIMPPSLSCW